MQSKAKTVNEYLKSLPPDRQAVMKKLRRLVADTIPKGFEEVMQYGMIGYVVPHKLYPAGYHTNPNEPLPFICLASQKNHIALYHMMVYQGKLHDWFVSEWKKVSSRKLDMGKSCIRFKNPDDIPFPLIKELVSKVTPAQWIEVYQKSVNRKK
ncbi:MAG: DUF1801 domain-containing protein [Flammeovirgaceae bacterium]|nr:MAG: DUF1801 domain-containing protein [Flammeovirgaceae bacterium]